MAVGISSGSCVAPRIALLLTVDGSEREGFSFFYSSAPFYKVLFTRKKKGSTTFEC
jgi:hypothetical protein